MNDNGNKGKERTPFFAKDIRLWIPAIICVAIVLLLQLCVWVRGGTCF